MRNASARLGATSRRAAAGFTINDILIVLTLMGLVFAIGLPRLGGIRERMALDSAAQQLAGDLRRAQVEAIKRNQSVELERTGATSYTIDFIGERSLSGGVTFGVGSADRVRMAAFGPPVGGGATFIVEYAGRQEAVSVSAAGMLTVQ